MPSSKDLSRYDSPSISPCRHSHLIEHETGKVDVGIQLQVPESHRTVCTRQGIKKLVLRRAHLLSGYASGVAEVAVHRLLGASSSGTIPAHPNTHRSVLSDMPTGITGSAYGTGLLVSHLQNSQGCRSGCPLPLRGRSATTHYGARTPPHEFAFTLFHLPGGMFPSCHDKAAYP